MRHPGKIVARVAGAHRTLDRAVTHTELGIVKSRSGQNRWATGIEVPDLILQLAGDLTMAALPRSAGRRATLVDTSGRWWPRTTRAHAK